MATVARSRGIRLKSIRTHERLMLTQKGERGRLSARKLLERKARSWASSLKTNSTILLRICVPNDNESHLYRILIKLNLDGIIGN